jgi:hypothetical protein
MAHYPKYIAVCLNQYETYLTRLGTSTYYHL